MNTRQYILWALIGVMSSTFLVAGAMKLSDLRQFQESILDYQLVGNGISGVVALWLPWMELVCAAALWHRRFRESALWSLGVMLLSFVIIVSITIIRDIHISCGCFGNSGGSLYVTLIIDVLLLAALSAAVIIHRSLLRGVEVDGGSSCGSEECSSR